jgi:hypothetical protein
VEKEAGWNGSPPLVESGQHAKFLQRLDNSRPAVFRVAEYLHRLGYALEIPAINYAPNAGAFIDYVDKGDIIITTQEGEKQIIEVKNPDKNFTDKQDWINFKLDTVFLGNKASVERQKIIPEAYFIVSNNLTHAIIVHKNTRKHWNITEKKAKNTGNVEHFYECPLKYVIFRDLRERPTLTKGTKNG